MNSRCTREFWRLYHALPADIRRLADKQYGFWRDDHWHPSLHFKKVKSYWVARVSEDYRAIGIEVDGTTVWFWIGPHDEYKRMLHS
jgi:hypothetical protein